MTPEPTGAGTLPPPPPAKTNPWVIIAAVVVLLCCLCFGAVGILLAFGGDLLRELGFAAALVVQGRG
jgi:hypothetical protein